MDMEGFRRDWFERITTRMVLSHSSGLPHGEPRKPLPIFFEPGTKYKYSADGYEYLQRIMEMLPLIILILKRSQNERLFLLLVRLKGWLIIRE